MSKPLPTQPTQPKSNGVSLEVLADELVQSNINHMRSLSARVAAGEAVYFGPYRKTPQAAPVPAR